jgi:ferritin
MKIRKSMQDVLNKQVNHEFHAAYLYLSMAAHFEEENFKGFANWMRKQAEEEKGHAMKIFNYVIERGGKVTLAAIDAPKTAWTSPLEAFEDAYKHEMKVTDLINAMMDKAIEEKDHASASFLKWFVDEQVEEEASTEEVVQKLKYIGENKNGLYMLDKELGQRN